MENASEEIQRRVAKGLQGFAMGTPAARIQLKSILNQAFIDGLLTLPAEFVSPVDVKLYLSGEVEKMDLTFTFEVGGKPAYYLKLLNEETAHCFYCNMDQSVLSPYKDYMDVHKAKYAQEFNTREEAEKFKSENDPDGDFEVVDSLERN